MSYLIISLWQKMHTLSCRCRLVKDVQHLPHFALCVPELRKTEWHLQTNGYILDGTAVATGNELRCEVLAVKAIHLSSFCANKEPLAFPTESYGGHRFLQLGLSEEKGDVDRDRFFFFKKLCCNCKFIVIPSQTDFTVAAEKKRWERRIVHQEGKDRPSPNCCYQK